MKKFLTNVRLAILFMHPGVREFAYRVLRGEVATGVSSRALATYALGVNDDLSNRPPFGGRARPYDPGDYRRCTETYNAAPKILQRKMKPIMDSWHDLLCSQGQSRFWNDSDVPRASDPYPKVFGRWA